VKQRFHLTVNGAQVEVEAEPDTPLLSVLRNDLDLYGARFGCGVGLCGACFVRVDGAAVPSCDTPMWSVEHKAVVTVEGLADDARLHPVQQALLDEQAAQCGFCIGGIMVSAATLLDDNPRPDEEAVAEALDRHLCRCGVQRRIVRAVVRAGQESP
jgi:Aerobic-type carbon monoxide dehydrogenase, small subunit CoxS/CutS homologs